jgi:hypothetical protein
VKKTCATINTMNQRKAQHNGWAEELKIYLSKILMCEMCRIRKATDHAHRLKRRLIGWRTDLDRLEYFMAAKLCRRCHKSLDEYVGPQDAHERMFLIITRIAVARPRGSVHGEYVPTHPVTLWDPQLIYRYSR